MSNTTLLANPLVVKLWTQANVHRLIVLSNSTPFGYNEFPDIAKYRALRRTLRETRAIQEHRKERRSIWKMEVRD